MTISRPASTYYTSSNGRVHPDSLAARSHPRRRDDIVFLRPRQVAPVEPPSNSERLTNIEAGIDSLAAEVREIAATVEGDSERITQLNDGLAAILGAIGDLRDEMNR
jgi:hypothetical protein